MDGKVTQSGAAGRRYYQENGGEDPSQLPEVLVSVGTIKMLLGDQVPQSS